MCFSLLRSRERDSILITIFLFFTFFRPNNVFIFILILTIFSFISQTKIFLFSLFFNSLIN
jgi:hypothetical protein